MKLVGDSSFDMFQIFLVFLFNVEWNQSQHSKMHDYKEYHSTFKEMSFSKLTHKTTKFSGINLFVFIITFVKFNSAQIIIECIIFVPYDFL